MRMWLWLVLAVGCVGPDKPEPLDSVGGIPTDTAETSDDTGSPAAPECGNGTVEPGEACDDGGESADCDADCTEVMCGDGLANATAGEACDDGGESAECDADCSRGAGNEG